jgi:biopolymer transport protein ExbD
MKALNRDEERQGLRIAPLIDVILLLLIFFMVTTSFSQNEKDITVALAHASEGSEREQAPSLVIVNVRKDGTIVVDQMLRTLAELERYLRSARSAHPRVVVVVRCDKEASHRHFVRVLNLCEKVGVSGVAVATFDTAE